MHIKFLVWYLYLLESLMIFKLCQMLITIDLNYAVTRYFFLNWATEFACIGVYFILYKIMWALATVPYLVLISKENMETLRTDPQDLSQLSLPSHATQRRPQSSTGCGLATTILVPTMYTSQMRGKTLSIHPYPQWCPLLSLLPEIFPMHFQ